jgi:hypothetical protein
MESSHGCLLFGRAIRLQMGFQCLQYLLHRTPPQPLLLSSAPSIGLEGSARGRGGSQILTDMTKVALIRRKSSSLSPTFNYAPNTTAGKSAVDTPLPFVRLCPSFSAVFLRPTKRTLIDSSQPGYDPLWPKH